MGYGTSRKPNEGVSINFETRGDSGPVILAHDHGTAVVMPMVRRDPDPTLEDDIATHLTAPLKGLIDSMEEGDTLEVNGKELIKK